MKYVTILLLLTTFTLFTHSTNATLDDLNTTLHSLDNRVTDTNAKLDALKYNSDALHLLAEESKFKLLDLNIKVENVTTQLLEQNTLAANANVKLDNISSKIDGSNQRLDNIEGRIVNLTNAFSNGVFLLKEEIQANENETRTGFQTVSAKTDGLQEQLVNLNLTVDKRFGDVLLPLYALAVLGVVFMGLFIGDKIAAFRTNRVRKTRRSPSLKEIEDGLNGR